MLLFPLQLSAADCSEATAVVKSYYQNLVKHRVNSALTKWETTTKQLKHKLNATRIQRINRIKLLSCDEEAGVARVSVDVSATTSCGQGKWRGTFTLNVNENDDWKIVSRRLKRYQRAECSCS
jgi:hypothetical protein